MGHAEVVPLDAVWSIDEDAVGPKAMSLVRMIRAGLPVPAGFCVTERVLRENLERNNLTARLKSLAEKIAEAIKRSPTNNTRIEFVDSLAKAIQLASRLSESRDIVLLSPACASYDMFDNFEHRGRDFCRLVRQISG